MEAGRDPLGIPRPTFGRTVNSGYDLSLLPTSGNWPELSLVTSPGDNDGAILVLHPWSCITFFTVVPASWNPADVERHVQAEAAMMAPGGDYLIEQEYIRSGILADERVDHLFVTCVPSSVRELTQRLSHRPVQIRSSLSAVASLILEASSPEGLELVLGWYAGHMEVIVVQEGAWLFGGFTVFRDPHDCLYYLASLLERLNLNSLDLGRIRQYGSAIESAPDGPLSQLFAIRPEVLRPSSAFPDARETFLSQPAFVPCAGAVIKQLFAEV